MTVAFIGLGMMGAPMAAPLARNVFKPMLPGGDPALVYKYVEQQQS